MSVINNVLKDLETRESSFTPIEITSVQQKTARPGGFSFALLAAALIVTAAAAFFLLRLQPGSGATVAVTAVVPAAAAVGSGDSMAAAAAEAESAETGSSAADELSPPPMLHNAPVHADDLSAMEVAAVQATPADDEPLMAQAEAAVNEAPLPNQIIGLQLRESEQAMQMEFVLRDRVVAYLRERGQNHFAYRLRDIESRIVAPRIRDNRWIRALSIDTVDGGVDIDFETAPDILVESRQSLADDEAVWVISLRRAARPDPAPAASETGPASGPEIEKARLEPAVAPAVTAETVATAEVGAAAADQPVKLEIKTTNPAAKDANRLEYAVELINSRRLSEAETLLRELLGGAEDYPARQRLIALYQRDRRPERVLQMARESMQVYPQDAVFKTEYARALFHRSAYREVIALFADDASHAADQLALVAASHQRLDEHDDAVRHYLLALEQDAGNAHNWVGLGISQEHTAALEDALNSYQRAGRLGGLNDRLQAFIIQRSDTLRKVLN